jgi:hypothetical protein
MADGLARIALDHDVDVVAVDLHGGSFGRHRVPVGVSLASERPALGAPGAIPIVEFLLYGFAGAVKEMGVENQDWTRRSVSR